MRVSNNGTSLNGGYFAHLARKRWQIGTDMQLIVTSTSDNLLVVSTSTTLNALDSLNSRFWCFFLQLLAVVHISSMNCAGITRNRAGQPAYKIFSIERTFLTFEFRPPRFMESSTLKHQI